MTNTRDTRSLSINSGGPTDGYTRHVTLFAMGLCASRAPIVPAPQVSPASLRPPEPADPADVVPVERPAAAAAPAAVAAARPKRPDTLVTAAKDGRVGDMAAMLAGGADVNARDVWGSTALIAAAQYRQGAAARAALDAGADAGAVNERGCGALLHAGA